MSTTTRSARWRAPRRPRAALALLATGVALLAAAPARGAGPGSGPAPAPPDSTDRPRVTAPVLQPVVNPTLAVAMSPVFPGWGQLAAGGGWRAVLAFGAEGFYWSHLLMNDRKADRLRAYADVLPAGAQRDFYDAQVHEYRERVRDFAWWSAGALLIIALDAYVGAHLQQFDRDPVPVPESWEPPGPETTSAPAASLAGTVLWCWRTSF